MSKVKSKALSIAIFVFFAVAILSYFAGCMPDTCCWRGLIGSVIAFFIAAWALRIIRNIIYDAITGTKNFSGEQVKYAGTDTDKQRS